MAITPCVSEVAKTGLSSSFYEGVPKYQIFYIITSIKANKQRNPHNLTLPFNHPSFKYEK